ncbi:MAG: carbohydrate porin [Syntrophobacteraceae bacterium]|nr:carbohydrate porin [Syntrophobacteraceae bacterium]
MCEHGCEWKARHQQHYHGYGQVNPGRTIIGRSLPSLVVGILSLVLLLSPVQAVRADDGATEAKTGLWERSNLLGDMGGLRTMLGDHGITFSLSETSEVLGNVTGGVKLGWDYEGATTMSLNLDADKAFGWKGGTFFVSALQLHGRGLSADYLYNINTVSGIEAQRTTRLWDLWYQQAFAGGKADVKIGQIGIDQEFIVSQCCGLYLNSAMGWPVLAAQDLYAGGPAFPLATPAVRFRVQPNDSVTLLAGVFDDNPPGGPFDDDDQLRDAEASGTRFNMTTGALFISEVQYAINPPPTGDACKSATGLPGTYKLGAWYDSAKFPDKRFNASGGWLAEGGIARMDRNNFSIYGIADQAIWREASGPRMVSVFSRLIGAPPDRNFIDWSLNSGINLKALLPGRGDDTLGIGYGWAHISRAVADFDRDSSLGSFPHPVRDTESFIEVTYQCQIAPWLIIQPDLQYIMNPGGGILNPLNPSHLIGNELVAGLRTIINF